ncbi:MAG: TIGR01906 family membrane protein [Dehalococcoidales bacterium]|nr:TIGR01906 family membrane protein [Dehalococcoidales bacterium]
MKITGIIAKWIFVLCLPFLLFTAGIGLAVNSSWLYNYGFEKYNVSQTTGITQPELAKAATGLISYFNSNEEYISLTVIKDGTSFELFNQREMIHLKDVKELIWLDYQVFLAMLIYILTYAGISLFWQKRRHWKQLAWGSVNGAAITLALMLVTGIGILINFDQLFLRFHLLSFSNDFWQLDPAKDYLIMLFPGGFWFDAALFCAGITIVLAIIIGGTAWGYLRFVRHNTFSD